MHRFADLQGKAKLDKRFSSGDCVGLYTTIIVVVIFLNCVTGLANQGHISL